MSKTILVANSKGGVGKTTIASELAYAAQNSGLKFDYYDWTDRAAPASRTSRILIRSWLSWIRPAR